MEARRVMAGGWNTSDPCHDPTSVRWRAASYPVCWRAACPLVPRRTHTTGIRTPPRTAHIAHIAHASVHVHTCTHAHLHTCNAHCTHAARGMHVCGACGMHVRRLLLLDGHALVVVGPQPVGRDVRAAHLRVLGEDIAWLRTRRRRRGGVGQALQQAALRRAPPGGGARRQGASAAWHRPRLGPHAARALLPRAHPLGPRGSSPEQVRGRLERWVAAWAAVAARRLASRRVASRGRGVLSTLGLGAWRVEHAGPACEVVLDLLDVVLQRHDLLRPLALALGTRLRGGGAARLVYRVPC